MPVNFKTLSANVVKTQALLAHARNKIAEMNSWDNYSESYKQQLKDQFTQEVTNEIKGLFEGMKNHVSSAVDQAKKKDPIDFAESQYHAITLDQEIRDMDGKQLLNKFEDIISEGNQAKRAEFERLASHKLKMSNDLVNLQELQNRSYQTLTPDQRAKADTIKAGNELPQQIGAIENFAMDALNGIITGEDHQMDNVILDSWNTVQGKYSIEE